MKNYYNLTDEEVFNACANKSLSQIIEMGNVPSIELDNAKEYQYQAVRYYLNRVLMDNGADNPLMLLDSPISAKMNDKHILIISMAMDVYEGIIIFTTDTDEEYEMDDFEVEELISILKQFEEI